MPLNPEAPPPIVPVRVVTAVRTAAYRNRKGLSIAILGGGMFIAMLALSVAVGVAFFGTAAFLAGAYIQSIITGAK